MTLGKKCVKKVVKLLQNWPGLKDTQGENTKSVEKPAPNVTNLLQSRPGLTDTQVVNTNNSLLCLQEIQEAVKEENQKH